jgi:hypothetical protein
MLKHNVSSGTAACTPAAKSNTEAVPKEIMLPGSIGETIFGQAF